MQERFILRQLSKPYLSLIIKSLALWYTSLLLAAATAEALAATEVGVETLTRATRLLVITTLAEALATATVAVTVASARGATVALAVLAAATEAVSLRAGGLLQGSRDDFRGEVEVVTEVLDTLVSEVVVLPLPRILVLHKVARAEGLHELEHVHVRNIKLIVLGFAPVVLCADDSLLEEVGVDVNTVLLGNKHVCCRRARDYRWVRGMAV